MFRAAVLVFSGEIAASALGLARNLLVARLLPVTDFGIAATFAIMLSIVEMISAFGLHQQIVQARDGDKERFQAALQGFHLLRGLINSIVLFLISAPIAHFMKLEDVTWAYQTLALVPLVNGLVHFDTSRLSRKRDFRPMVLTKTIPPLVGLLMVWPLMLWLGDYRVMLGVILSYTMAGLLTSHLVAQRPYRIAFDRNTMTRSLRFGWPIMANGVLLFGVFQGDRLIVGRELGVEALAVFSMAVMLTLTPTSMLTRTFQSIFLPVLSAAQDMPKRFAGLTATTLQIMLLAGLLLVAGTVAVGQPLALLLLGDKYNGLMPLLSWMALAQALRMVSGGPAIVALALAETSNAMYANLARLVMLPIIWYVAVTAADLILVVKIGFIAEAMVLAVALSLLRYKAGVALDAIRPATLAAIPFAILVMIQANADRDLHAQFAPYEVLIGMAVLVSLAFCRMPELHKYIRIQLKK